MLYPVDNEIRQVKSLDGIWRFKKENRMEEGFEEKWYEKPLSNFIDMPVPASYNDITTDKELRDHVGWVWYETDAVIPRACRDSAQLDERSARCDSFWQRDSACSCLFKR